LDQVSGEFLGGFLVFKVGLPSLPPKKMGGLLGYLSRCFNPGLCTGVCVEKTASAAGAAAESVDLDVVRLSASRSDITCRQYVHGM